MIRSAALSLAVLCALGLGANAARATAVTTLIAEKARTEMAYEMPEKGHFEVTLRDGDITSGTLVSAFWMDRQSGQFAANVVTADGSTYRVDGLAVLTVDVPVPTRRIMPGTLLSRADFRTIPVPYARIGAFAVTGLDQLRGMEARRMLAEGRPVPSQSVSAPVVVGRGERVSIQYDRGGMTLSAPGRAIGDAEADRPVRVVNLASNRTVTGIARPGGIVEVSQ